MKPSFLGSDPVVDEDASDSDQFINNYNGAHGKLGPCTAAEWEKVRPLFRTALGPMSEMAPKTLRKYTCALVRVAVWTDTQGLPLTVANVLDAQVIEAYCSTLLVGAADARSRLRRIAQANGVNITTAPLGYTRRQVAAPYTSSELDALFAFAAGMTNANRRTSLLALLVLGAGAGLARSDLRGVCASSVHNHDDQLFVLSGEYCAAVQAEYVAELTAVCQLRPAGQLIGNHHSKNVTSAHVSWVHGRVGVPELNADRLRSTYICTLIAERVALTDIMEWTGLTQMQTLINYWTHVPQLPARCSLTKAV
jgi:hypothetical protein